MQIDYFTEESMSFKITNTGGDDAIKVFNSVLRKCRTVAMKKGFSNMFNSEEKAFIQEFTDTLLSDSTKITDDNAIRY
jgi:hypothetical protein